MKATIRKLEKQLQEKKKKLDVKMGVTEELNDDVSIKSKSKEDGSTQDSAKGSNLTLIRPGGGHISPPVFQKIIALEPNVGLTSDQAVNSSFSVVLRSKKRKRPIRTMKRPWRALFYRGSPGISLAGSIIGSLLGSMKVQEGPLSLGRVPQLSLIHISEPTRRS